MSSMKFLFVLVQLGAAAVQFIVKARSKRHFANCVAVAVVQFTTLIENFRLCSFAKAGIILNLFLNFEQK